MRLKTETKIKQKIIFVKNAPQVKNDKIFLQKLMCLEGKEKVLFLCDYLSAVMGVDFSENAQKAADGITSIKELAINGNDLKEAGFKSYKIKEALNVALSGVIEGKSENTKDSLLAYVKKRPD